MAASLASTGCKRCFPPLGSFSPLGSWTLLSLSLFSRRVSPAPSLSLSALLAAPSSALSPAAHASSLLLHSLSFVSLLVLFATALHSLPCLPPFLSCSHFWCSSLPFSLSLILIHNILKERLITLAWPCLTSGEWFSSGSFWCGLCEIDESCSICSSKLCLWKARIYLLGMPLFRFPETRPKDRRNPCYFPRDHHPHRSLNARKRWSTLPNPPFNFFFNCCYSHSPHIWDFYPQRRFLGQPLIWIWLSA